MNESEVAIGDVNNGQEISGEEINDIDEGATDVTEESTNETD